MVSLRIHPPPWVTLVFDGIFIMFACVRLARQAQATALLCPAEGTFSVGVCTCSNHGFCSQVGEDEHRVGGRSSLRLQLDLCRLYQPHAVLEKDLVAC